ncbi:DUF6350 family protein [Amycolatopsis albispora]|uniref:Uncharacterized protein n=1 Tax=Amycolatopsis albispora TaxID=1804986 RepID=A0A344LFV3_9PSEU|nr:DUF6350 family protein [Amycolatopsis albispora]AXB46927.1 hypothetical protein A4R43_34480 [Amycolatopsis albispora]
MQVLTTGPDGAERLSDHGTHEQVTGAARVRVLLVAAVLPLLVGYTLAAGSVAAVAGLAPGSGFTLTGALRGGGPAWLATQQVPLGLGGHPLSVLPLLPTIVLLLLVAKVASAAARRLGHTEPGQAIGVVGVIACAHATAGVTVAVLCSGTPVEVEPLTAFLLPGVLSGAAATAGVLARCGLPEPVRQYVDPVAVRGLRAGALGLAALLVAGALVVLLGFGVSVPETMRLFDAETAGSGAGMLLVSVVYLPNAVVAGLSFAAGPGFSIGAVNVTPFAFDGGPVPALPILAALPEERAAWWPALLVLPVLAGALCGWTLRRCDPDPLVRVRAAAIAGATAGFGCVLLGTFAGGRFGDALFDPVSVPVALFSLAGSCWVALPAALVAWVSGSTAPVVHAPVEEEIPADEAVTEVFDAIQDDAAEETGDEPDESAEDAAETDGDTEDTEDPEDPEDTADPEDTEDAAAAEEAEAEPEAEEPVEPAKVEPAEAVAESREASAEPEEDVAEPAEGVAAAEPDPGASEEPERRD